MNTMVLAGSALMLAASAPDPKAVPRISHPVEGTLRLVVVGDVGVVHKPTTSPCVEGESCKLSIDGAAELWASVKAEDAHAAFITGDLVYGPRRIQSAPRCRTPGDPLKARWLDPALGDKVRELGIPVYLSLGNHDTGHQKRAPLRERCIMAYAASEPALKLPQLNYVVDFGPARLVVLDTNMSPQRWPAEAFADHDATWTIMGGHHVIRTLFDKESERAIRTWLVETDNRPDLWVNGHAHFLQFGVYDGIPAATSGAGAKVRMRPRCPGPECVGDDLPQYSNSIFGYALVEVSKTRLQVTFKDATGAPVFCWERTPDSAEGMPCDPTEAL